MVVAVVVFVVVTVLVGVAAAAGSGVVSFCSSMRTVYGISEMWFSIVPP